RCYRDWSSDVCSSDLLVIRLHGPWDLFFGINRTSGAAMNRVLTNLERQSCDYADVLTAPSRTMSAYLHERWRLAQVPLAIPNFRSEERRVGRGSGARV